MTIIDVDYHPSLQAIVFLAEETVSMLNRTVNSVRQQFQTHRHCRENGIHDAKIVLVRRSRTQLKRYLPTLRRIIFLRIANRSALN